MRTKWLHVVLLLVSSGICCRGAADNRPQGKSYFNRACKINAKVHYNIFVPGGYEAKEATPILFLFSPSGNAPVARFKEVGDKLGWLVCGSVESRSGLKWEDQAGLFKVLREEMRTLFHVDKRRIYVAGMGSGARVALKLYAEQNREIAGAICVGAGVSSEYLSELGSATLVGIAGERDPQYFESFEMIDGCRQNNIPYLFLEWDGGKAWPSTTHLADAMGWLEYQFYIRSSDLTAAESKKRDSLMISYCNTIAGMPAKIQQYEAFDELAEGLTLDDVVWKQLTEALQKLKPEVQEELKARSQIIKMFSAVRAGDDNLYVANSRLYEELKKVALAYGNTLYGRRAGTLVRTLGLFLEENREKYESRKKG